MRSMRAAQAPRKVVSEAEKCSCLSHFIFLMMLLLMPQEGPLIENVEARMEGMVREVCEQLKHRVKW